MARYIGRYVGIYSRRGYRHRQYDPRICPYCKKEMELVEICFEGTDSYPEEEPPPVEPPPDYQHSQRDRIGFIISVIKNNQNGRGASIEKVIYEAAKIGMNREQAISYIEHLKHHGSAYEPINGEIKYAF